MGSTILWLLAGALAGWVGYTYMKLNKERSLIASILTGMIGGLLGGGLLAPLLYARNAVNPTDFNPFPLLIALASAAAILIISSMIHRRFGI